MESVFSMIVIMICFGVCMMIFNTITSDRTGALQVTARIRLQAEAERCKAQHDLSESNVQYEEFVLRKSFSGSEEIPGLIRLHFSAVAADGKPIAEYYEYIVR
jgi:hypothetical protein